MGVFPSLVFDGPKAYLAWSVGAALVIALQARLEERHLLVLHGDWFRAYAAVATACDCSACAPSPPVVLLGDIDMHMHVDLSRGMRTTVELSDRHRARLLELAAERGEKGFSRIVQEAVEQYLLEQGSRRERVEQALQLRGSLGAAGADALEESVKAARGSWR